MTHRILVLKLGNMQGRLAGRLAEFLGWVREALCGQPIPVLLVDPRGDALPEPGPEDVIVTTGGRGSTYAREPWSEAAGEWLVRAIDGGVPVFAICYGHQLLAQALGGRVALNPRGPEHGTFEVARLTDDPLFDGMDERFFVYETHFDVVLDLPPGATALARSERTAVQAMAVGDRVRTIQWHPECFAEGQAPPDRAQVLRNFLRHCAGVPLGDAPRP